MEVTRTHLRNLHQVRTSDINLQFYILRHAGNRHLDTTLASNDYLVFAIHHLQLLLQLLQKLLVLDSRVIQPNTALITIILSIVDISHHLYIYLLERFLKQVILYVRQISIHRSTIRIKAARRKASNSQEHSGTSHHQTQFLHIHSIFKLFTFLAFRRKKEAKGCRRFQKKRYFDLYG